MKNIATLILVLFLIVGCSPNAYNVDRTMASNLDGSEEKLEVTKTGPVRECVEKWSCTDWEPEECPKTESQTRSCTDSNNCGTNNNKPFEKEICIYTEKVIEMTITQISEEFSRLTDLQMEEKLKKLKGKRIKTSIYVDTINEAPSSQYIVREYPYNSPAIQAFFPYEEKDNLLIVNTGDTIIFSGEFVSYTKGTGYFADLIEFTNSKLIEIK